MQQCQWYGNKAASFHCIRNQPRTKKENYRPVCILPSASKVMEKVIRKQLASYFEKTGILPGSQFGFRARRSTVQAAAAAEHDWKKAKLHSLLCGALFFDLSAAFDCISAEILTEKMRIYGVSTNATRLVSSYLTDRKQRVDYGGANSNVADMTVGSPQGSAISPLLFLILVADVEEWVTEGTLLTYADDTSVYAFSKSREEVRRILEKSAEEILCFMRATGLAANEAKTSFLFFGRKQEEPIKVGDAMIQEDTEATLLGITFNKALTWKAHLDNLKPELKKRVGILRKLSTKLPRHITCRMIEPIFTSKVRYAIELIADTTAERNTALQVLHQQHRNAMKAALGMSRRKHPSDDLLYRESGQVSMASIAAEAAVGLAWKCGQDWDQHPLTSTRVEKHLSGRATRQATQRCLPPQSTRGSLVGRLVEIWESFPDNIKQVKEWVDAKTDLKSLVRETDYVSEMSSGFKK